MKKRLQFFLILCLSMFLFAPFSSYAADDVNRFSDISKDNWYYDNVKYVYENKLMNGVSNREFAPDASVTRAMAATILYRMDGVQPNLSLNSYSDVEGKSWYFDAVTWITNCGVASGYGNGKFGSNDNITREQFITMLYNHYDYYRLFLTYNTTHAGESVIDAEKCSDYSSVSEWAKEAVRWAAREGIIKGNENKIEPQSFITRAEMAAIVERYNTWMKLIDEKYEYRYCLIMLEYKDDNGNFQGTASWVKNGTSIKDTPIMKDDKTIEGIYLDPEYTMSAEETVINDAQIIFIKELENKLGSSVINWTDEEIESIYRVTVLDNETGTIYDLNEPSRVGDFLTMLVNFEYTEKVELDYAEDKLYTAEVYSTNTKINGSKIRFDHEVVETEIDGKVMRYTPYDPSYLTEDTRYFRDVFYRTYS